MGGISSSSINLVWGLAVQKPMMGMGVEFWFNNRLALEIDGYYVNKAVHSEAGFYRKLPELAISGLMRYWVPIKNGSLSVLAGYEVGIFLVEVDHTSNFASFDRGLVIGSGFDYRMKRFSLFAELRYRFPGPWIIFDYIKYRSAFQTRTLLFIAGIKFKIGK